MNLILRYFTPHSSPSQPLVRPMYLPSRRTALIVSLLAATVIAGGRDTMAQQPPPEGITARVLDANRNPKTTFKPGDNVIVAVDVNLPAATVANKDFSVGLKAGLQMNGFVVPFSLSNLLQGRNSFPDGSGSAQPLASAPTEEFRFQIPPETPDCNISVVATVKVKVGTVRRKGSRKQTPVYRTWSESVGILVRD